MLFRSALDLDLPEAQVILDEDDPRRVRDVRRSRSLPEVRGAYQMIEDFMLAANEAVARWFHRRGVDCAVVARRISGDLFLVELNLL